MNVKLQNQTGFYSKVIVIGALFQLLGGNLLAAMPEISSDSKTLAPITFWQSEITVQGTVTSQDDGTPIPYVNVLVKGTAQGTLTDENGKYRITTSQNQTLVFSSIGYTEQEVTVGDQNEIDIKLAVDIAGLDEVVITGYTQQKVGNLTGAVAVVKGEELDKVVATSMTDKLSGRVAGVTVRNSGDPGSTGSILIRGVTNFNGTGPLWVIDGVQTTDSRDLNPNDVESIQVLKDAASAAQYGARGANGVIVVTTKRGEEGPLRISLDARTGLEDVTKTYNLMDRAEWAAITRMMYANNPDQEVYPGVNNTAVDTDWQDAFLRQGEIQQYDLTISGGGNNADYLVSGGYYNRKGTIIGSDFERYTARVNGGLNNDRFSIKESVLLSYSTNDGVQGNPFNDAIRMLPIIPVYDPNQPTGFGIGTADAPTLATNPVAQQDIELSTVESFRVLGNITGEYKIFDFLKYRLSLSAEFNNSNFFNARKEGQVYRSQPEAVSRYGEGRDRTFNTIVENFLQFDKSYDKHTISVLAGYAENKYRFKNVGANVMNIPQNSAGKYFFQISQGGETTGVNGGENFYGLRSFIGRLDYDYADKYLLSAGIRRDGSSRFGPDNKYGNFPSVSLGWRVSAEPFFERVPIISNLKLRASYGEVGNDEIGDYQYDAFINTNARYILGPDQQVAPGSIQRGLSNPSIQWNAQKTTNLGFDLGLFEDHLTANFNYYIAKSEDLLVSQPLPWALGNALGDPPVNVGSMENRGVELGLTYQNTIGDFSYAVTANVSTNKNKVLSLGEGSEELFSGNSRTVVGEPIGRFFVLRTDGIFQTAEEISGSAQPEAQPGDQRYRDVNGRDENNELTGQPDGMITADDREFVGNPWPKVIYSLNASAYYKNFDFNMLWNGKYKFNAYNSARYQLVNTGDIGNYQAGLTPWTPENRSTTTPRAVIGEPLRGDTDRFLEDASFLRLINLQLGYTLPSSLWQNLAVKSLRLSASVQNVFTITDYSGLDADFERAGILSPGQDNTQYPAGRQFLFGLHLEL